ncbi:MAG: FAD binding domain-containing protein [Candidatus Hodarchaeota archaeon]
MHTIKEFIYPSNIKNALMYLSDESTGIIAGGTHINTSSQKYTRFVDITRLNLKYIKEKGNKIIIGSTTTISEMLESPLVQKVGNGLLTKACNLIGDTPLRNVITLGGNIALSLPWAGLPAALLVLDAEIVIMDNPESSKTIVAEEYFKLGKVNQGEIIKEVIFPIRKDWFSRYEKFALTKVDYTWLTLAFSVKLNQGVVEKSRIAISRISKHSRLPEVEEMMLGIQIDILEIEKLVAKIKNSINIVSDYRSSKSYRKHLLGILFKGILTDMKETVY